MSFIEIMHTYFQGEKMEAIFFILPIGILLIAFGILALKVERGGYAWGVAVPCIICGLILAGTGAGIGIRTSGQIAEITKNWPLYGQYGNELTRKGDADTGIALAR